MSVHTHILSEHRKRKCVCLVWLYNPPWSYVPRKWRVVNKKKKCSKLSIFLCRTLCSPLASSAKSCLGDPSCGPSEEIPNVGLSVCLWVWGDSSGCLTAQRFLDLSVVILWSFCIRKPLLIWDKTILTQCLHFFKVAIGLFVHQVSLFFIILILFYSVFF